MEQTYTVVTSDIVTLNITSSVSSFASERRFPKDITIANLKGKLELLTGASPAFMVLEVYNKDDKLTITLTNDHDEALLGSFHIDDGMRIHVIDKSGKAGEFEDTSKVQKFELSEEEYAQKRDTVRAFKEKMKLGRFADQDPEELKRQEEEKQKKLEEEQAQLDAMNIGDRCEVNVVGQPPKRGCVMFKGEAAFKPGLWVGIRYDEPLGKNDGSVQGKRYFECPPKYGGFVKAGQVTVGDFPEIDEFDDLDEM